MIGNFGVIQIIILLIYLVGIPFLFWRIFSKAGYHGAWGLLAILPFGLFGLLIFLAAAEWPNQTNKRVEHV